MDKETLKTGLGYVFREKFLEFGLIVYVLACPYSISASQIGLSLAFLAILLKWGCGDFRPKFLPLDHAFAAFAIAGAFSLANAVDVGRAFAEMKKFLIIAVFWTAAWSGLDRSRQRRLLAILIGSGMSASVLGLLKMVYIDQNLRAYGWFSLPMTFGEIQALIAIVALGWLCQEERSRLLRGFLLFSFFLLGIGLLVSFTRGAWLGFAAGFFVLLIRHLRRLAPIFFILAIGFAMGVLISSGIRNRLTSFDFKTNFFRFRIWQIGFDILETQPIFGVGMNNVKPLYAQRVRQLDIQRQEVHGHLHSTFMQILVMTGIFGFTMFCWFLVRLFSHMNDLTTTLPDPWLRGMATTMIAVLAAFLVSGLTEYTFGDEEVAMLVFFLAGLAGTTQVRGPTIGSGNRIPIPAS